jgi:hypothetical protein
MRDAEIECPMDHRAGVLEYVDAAEVVPQAEGYGRELEPAPPAPIVGHRVVASVGWLV